MLRAGLYITRCLATLNLVLSLCLDSALHSHPWGLAGEEKRDWIPLCSSLLLRWPAPSSGLLCSHLHNLGAGGRGLWCRGLLSFSPPALQLT